MAEGVGFEPTIPVKVCQFSRLVHSSTLPTLLFKSSLQRSFLASEVILLLYMAGQQYPFMERMHYSIRKAKAHLYWDPTLVL